MNAHRWLGLCVVAVLMTFGAALAADVAKELKALEGTWEVTSIISDGTEVPQKAIKGLLFIFAGDILRVDTPEGKGAKMKIKIDPSMKPKAIDIPYGSVNMPGIYQLDGDKLKICMQRRKRGARPTQFEAKKDSSFELTTLKRAKK